MKCRKLCNKFIIKFATISEISSAHILMSAWKAAAKLKHPPRNFIQWANSPLRKHTKRRQSKEDA